MKHGEIKIVEYDSNENELVIFGAYGKLVSSGVTVDSISGGSANVSTLITISNVHSYAPPTSNFATIDTRNSYKILDFDDTAVEAAVFTLIMPQSYTGGSVMVIPHFAMASATTGNVVIESAFERVGNEFHDIDSDSFATANSATISVPSTSGFVKSSSAITHTAGSQMDGVLAGELFRLRITRNGASGSDTATGDMELLAIEIREV